MNHLSNIKIIVKEMRKDYSDITGFEFSYNHKMYDVICEVDPNLSWINKRKRRFYKMLLIFFKPTGNPLRLLANSNHLSTINGNEYGVIKQIRRFFNISYSELGNKFDLYRFYDALNNSIHYYKTYPSKRLSRRVIDTVNKKYPNDANKIYCNKMGNNGKRRSQENTDKAKVYCNGAYKYLIKTAHDGAPRISFFFYDDPNKKKSSNEIVHNAIKNHTIDRF